MSSHETLTLEELSLRAPAEAQRGFAPAQALPSKIFNTEKTDYELTPLFFGQDAGLLDTINKQYPKLWKLYKTLRSLDWDENEFSFTSCNVEFATCDRDSYDFMIKTLAWQWEADSMASRAIASIMGPVCSSTELWCGYVKINENENVHALTYSEIVRSSFDNPSQILGEILEVKEAMSRLDSVARVMQRAHDTSHRYALKQVGATQEAYNDIFMFVVALYFLERIQFMSSFAVTFALCRTGLFQPIGKAVERIAQDEFEIHAQFGQEVLKIELATERGRTAMHQCRGQIIELFKDITNSELSWNQYIFDGGKKELTGYNLHKADRWVLFNAKAPAHFLGIHKETGYDFPDTNPAVFMEDYMDVSASQAAPQEENNGQYKVNVMLRDDEGQQFDFGDEFD